MPPESFDRSKTDLQSLLRSGTWLYAYSQGSAASHPNSSDRLPPASPSNGTSNGNGNSIHPHHRPIHNDLDHDSRSLDDLPFRDVNGEDLPFQTFNFEPSLEPNLEPNFDDRNLEPSQPNRKRFAPQRFPFASPQTKRSWKWLLLGLGVLIPIGLLQGLQEGTLQGFYPMSIPQSASRLSPPVDPALQTAPTILERPTQEANQDAIQVSQDDIFRVAVKMAMQASELTQTAQTRQEWQRVASRWQGAIDGMAQITVQSPHYAVAQDRLAIYTQNLNYAQTNAGVLP